MSANITVTLSKPIEHNGESYSELSFREPELGDFIAADAINGELGKTAAVLASMADVPFPAMKRLSMSDMNKIMDAVGHLMGNAPQVESGD